MLPVTHWVLARSIYRALEQCHTRYRTACGEAEIDVHYACNVGLGIVGSRLDIQCRSAAWRVQTARVDTAKAA